MNNTVSLNVDPGQLAIVLSTDSVQALEHWMRLNDQALAMSDDHPDLTALTLNVKDATSNLAFHVRAAYDHSQR